VDLPISFATVAFPWNYINENYILLTERSMKEDLNTNEIKEENTGKLNYDTFAKCEAKFLKFLILNMKQLQNVKCRGIIVAPSQAKLVPPPRHYCACVGAHMCTSLSQRSTRQAKYTYCNGRFWMPYFIP
jgi:hypothetical protein